MKIAKSKLLQIIKEEMRRQVDKQDLAQLADLVRGCVGASNLYQGVTTRNWRLIFDNLAGCERVDDENGDRERIITRRRLLLKMLPEKRKILKQLFNQIDKLYHRRGK